MDRELEIYIIDGISYEKHTKIMSEDGFDDSTTQSFVENLSLNNFRQMMQRIVNFADVKTTKDINIHIVDENLKCRYFYTDEGNEFFANLLELIKNPFIHLHDCKWNDFLPSFTPSNEKSYIFITPNKYQNDYYFFNYLNLKIAPNFFILHSAISLLQCEKAKSIYNIFDNINPNNSIDVYGRKTTIDLKAIEYVIENGVTCANYLKSAGLLNKERFIQCPIPCWCLNIKSLFINGIIQQYDELKVYKVVLEEKLSIGKLPREKFLESAEYRYLILDLMCRTLCNYGLNFGKIKFVENHLTFTLDRLLM